MNSRTIERLRRKFIWVAMLAIFLTMLFIGGTIWLTSWIMSQAAIKKSLDLLVSAQRFENRIPFEDYYTDNPTLEEAFRNTVRDAVDYWIIVYDQKSGQAEISGRYSEDSRQYLLWLGDSVKETEGYGHQGRIYYKCVKSGKSATAAFIDATAEINSVRRLLFIAMTVAAAGLAITYVMVLHFSDRVVRSEIENLNKQKDFITNASHELKTPLAVIRANTEMSRMINGEDEWSDSTMKQIDHLSGLIQNLVMISKAEEMENKEDRVVIDVSSTVEDTVKTFSSMANQEKISLTTAVEENVKLKADASKIMQLVTILIDNAIKYCDDEGEVSVELIKLRKGIRLCVSNSYKDGEGADCDKFFERFYREDKSHNIDKGGYGIGLSIAESIVKEYKGSIKASWKNGVISFICVLH